LADVQSRFVDSFATSKTRIDIWSGWQRHRADFEKLGIRFGTLIGGSFTTTKIDPNDVDLCIIFESSDVAALDAAGLAQLGKLTAVGSLNSDAVSL
ncbi:MAG: DUF6932 family protein, partial [Sphingomicrobium sp.]